MPTLENYPFAVLGFLAWRKRIRTGVISAAARQIRSSQGAGKEDGTKILFI